MDSNTEVDSLCEKVHNLEQKLHQAAEFGKQLLDANSELTDQLDKQAKEHRIDWERLEQEKYSLQMRLEQKSLMEKTLTEEVENLQSALKQLQKEDKGREDTDAIIFKLKSQVQTLQIEHDKLQLGEKQLRERVQELEQQLEDTRQQLSQKVSVLNETCGEEVAGLHAEITRLHGDKLDLGHQLSDLKAELEQQQFDLTSAQRQLLSCQSDLNDQRAMASSYSSALEKCREEAQELRVQMDIMKMDQQNHKKKGNSLFGEVEDRRIEAEKELISMKVQCESYKKQFEASRQQMHKLKLQMSGLLMMSGRACDGERLESLQRQLSHARSELCEVTEKLHKYEKKEMGPTDFLAQFQDEYGDNSNMKYTEYLLLLIERKQKEMEAMEAKLQAKELQLLTQGDTLMNSERRNYETQKQLEATQGQNIKLQVKLEELQLKYEPDSFDVSNKVRKVRLEKIALGPKAAESADITANTEADTPIKNCKEKSNEGKSTEKLSKKSNTDKNKVMKTDSSKEVKKDLKGVSKSKEKNAIELNKKAMSKDTSKRLPLVATLATNEEDPVIAIKPAKTRKVTISDKEDVFELSECLDEGSAEGLECTEGNQGRQKPKGRVNAKTTVHVTKDSEKPECNTQ